MLQTTSALVLARGSPQVCLFRLNCCKMAEVMHVKYENGKVERIFLPQTVSDEFGVCTRLMWNTQKCLNKTKVRFQKPPPEMPPPRKQEWQDEYVGRIVPPPSYRKCKWSL